MNKCKQIVLSDHAHEKIANVKHYFMINCDILTNIQTKNVQIAWKLRHEEHFDVEKWQKYVFHGGKWVRYNYFS